ncbi:hypothetical protein H8959_006418 [Pygathrix nigripes]
MAETTEPEESRKRTEEVLEHPQYLLPEFQPLKRPPSLDLVRLLILRPRGGVPCNGFTPD